MKIKISFSTSDVIFSLSEYATPPLKPTPWNRVGGGRISTQTITKKKPPTAVFESLCPSSTNMEFDWIRVLYCVPIPTYSTGLPPEDIVRFDVVSLVRQVIVIFTNLIFLIYLHIYIQIDILYSFHSKNSD